MSEPAPTVGAGGTRGRLRAVTRAALARVGLLVGSVALACCAGEAATRALYPPVRGISWYHYDARYAYKHRPGVDQETTEWGERKLWRFRTNRRGFRWPEWADAPAAGTSRVLVMGDSFTFANAVETEQAFPAVADAALRARGPWEVINAGVSAWGPENALAYLETEGAPIRASCLVYAFYEGNDVMDAHVRPLYELKGGALTHLPLTKGPPTRSERVREVMHAIPVYDGLLAHSQLFNLARSAFLLKATGGDGAGAAGAADEEKPATFVKSLEETLATLDRLDQLGRERFGAFALLMIPLREAALVGPGAVGPVMPERLTPEWIAEASHARVLAWAKERGVPVIDARPRFPADPAGIKALYFSRDFHMSVAGNQLLGSLLAERAEVACAARPR
jgi:hypothetical protein